MLPLAGCAHLGGDELASLASMPAAGTDADSQAGTPLAIEPPATTPAPPADAWARLRAGYVLPPQTNPRIDAQLDWYARHQAYLDRVTARAQPYFYYILEELDARGMPAEIALLPIVESAYDPFAYSHGRAAGMWQFIPGTGRMYDLSQNWWYDGRRDVAASTRAALDYLQDLYGQFGDWLLALAAYNCGSGNVVRAIRHNERRGLPTDFWHLNLPRETSAYVPKLLALKRLIGTPADYNIQLDPIPNTPYLGVASLDAQIDLALAADLAGISLRELYLLNPGFNRWATAPDGPFDLLLPLDRIEQFTTGLQQVPPEQRLRWQRHRIRAGETLGGIARRYAVTVDILQDINNIRGNIIRAGDYLMVPTATEGLDNYVLSAPQRLEALQNRPRDGAKVEHTVQTGESFWSIARSYDVSVRALAKWNGMAPTDMLRAGQQLVVWAQDTGNRPLTKVAAVDTIRTIWYTVRRGDSLAKIASKFGVTVRKIADWNNLNLEKYLQPGQRLKVQVDVTRVSS